MSSGPRPRSDSRPPPKLPERYRLRRHIASGGMAAVWRADDLVLDRSVAIKILAERFADDQLAVRRFKREARTAARACAHAHVVTVFDVGDCEPEDGEAGGHRAFIVMEYLAGGTVADAIHVGAVRRHEALRWLGEAASALDHAHARGIVHRDIKPANFLLDRGRVLHVADFGIARLTSEDTLTSSDELFGTAAYLSPEQAVGREATGASDRYALAVAAFELLAGERPFTAPHFAAQARQHIEAPPPSASDRNRTLPPAVDEVLGRGMAKNPQERFPSAGEMVRVLQRALTEVAVSPARPLPPAAAVRRHRPSADTLAAAGAAARRPAAASRATRLGGNSRSSAGHRGRRAVALGALLVAVFVAVAIGLAAGGGMTHGNRSASSATGHAAPTVASTFAPATGDRRASPRRTTPRRAGSAASSTTSTPSTSSASPAPNAAQLQLTGHREMLDGDYQSAIPTLRQAVSSSSPGSLTYAYALYDLGRSLVLGGDPGGAVPILRQRLKIPDQTAVVQQLLDQALKATGATPAPTRSPTPAAPAQPTRPGQGDGGPGRSSRPGSGHHGPTGGAGLAPGTGEDNGQGIEHVSLVV